MTFQEAEAQLLKVNPNPYVKDNYLHQAIIVPIVEEDFTKFLADVKEGVCSVKDVKKYTTNGEYFVWSGNKEFHNLY
jgi:membrane glycosyltransferase